MRQHRLTIIGDWVQNRRRVFKNPRLPPAHLLRRVFEDAQTYAEAQDRLAHTPIAMPALFILAGMHENEGCVIERTEDDAVIRPLQDNRRVCATNQFESCFKNQGHGWRPRPVKSAERLRCATTLALETVNESFEWFIPPIANSHTRLAMMANAAQNMLCLFGTQGAKRVTEIFRL